MWLRAFWSLALAARLRTSHRGDTRFLAPGPADRRNGTSPVETDRQATWEGNTSLAVDDDADFGWFLEGEARGVSSHGEMPDPLSFPTKQEIEESLSRCQHVFRGRDVLDRYDCKATPRPASATVQAMLAHADAIYILFADCHDIVGYPWVAGPKTIFVDALEFDMCMQVEKYDAMRWIGTDSNSITRARHRRASLIHLAAVDNAKRQYFRAAAIFEADVRLTEASAHEWTEPHKAAFVSHIASSNWDLIRLAYTYRFDFNWKGNNIEEPPNGWEGVNLANGWQWLTGKCLPECECAQEDDQPWCKMEGTGCIMGSAAAYMIASHAYEDFIAGILVKDFKKGCSKIYQEMCVVDLCPFARLRNTYVLPAMAMQHGKGGRAAAMNPPFYNNCVGKGQSWPGFDFCYKPGTSYVRHQSDGR